MLHTLAFDILHVYCLFIASKHPFHIKSGNLPAGDIYTKDLLSARVTTCYLCYHVICVRNKRSVTGIYLPLGKPCFVYIISYKIWLVKWQVNFFDLTLARRCPRTKVVLVYTGEATQHEISFFCSDFWPT